MFKKAALLTLMFLFVFSFIYAKERTVSHTRAAIQLDKFQMKKVDWDRSIQGTASHFWDFDGAFPPPGWQNWDWQKTGNNTRRGSGCAFCDVSVVDPGNVPYPDARHNDLYSDIYPVPDPNMKGIKLEFWANFDYPDDDFLRVWIEAWDAGGYLGEFEAFARTGNNGRYRKYVVDWEDTFGYVKVTEITHVRFAFCHQWLGANGAVGLGGFIDDVKLIFHYYDQTVAMFEAMPLAGRAPLEVQFMNTSNGTPNHFIWDYGDGTSEEIDDARPWDVHPYHVYDVGMYEVSLYAWVNHLNNRIDDLLVIPNMIYADPILDYIPLTLLSSGDTWPGETWEDVIDHDIWGANCKVLALPDQSEATFQLSTLWSVEKIRIMVDNAEVHECQTNFAKLVEVTLSMDEMFDDADPAVMVECDRLNGEWNCLDLPVPIEAQYAKVDIVEARGGRYHEMVEIQLMGTEATLAKELPLSAIDTPTSFDLAQNSPNPFNPTTDIRFDLPEEAEVQLSIYNIRGQLVRTLANGKYNAGAHTLTWDALDLNGLPVAGGVYIYKLQAIGAEKTAFFTKKMILMK